MKIITTILLIIACQSVFSQQVHYDYDNAGNQTGRIAYSSSSTEANSDDELTMEQLLTLVEQTANIESNSPSPNSEENTNSSSLADRLTLANDLNITVYPNPATDVVYLNKDVVGIQKEVVATVYLINSQGKILERIKTTDTRTAINVRNLAGGVYYVRYLSDGESLAWRVVKL